MSLPLRLARLLSLFSLVGRKLQEEGDGYRTDIGLSASQLAVMRGLWQGDRCTLSDLSCQCCCAPPKSPGSWTVWKRRASSNASPTPGTAGSSGSF